MSYQLKLIHDLALDYPYQIANFPASIKYHHNQRGGWGQHIGEVTKIMHNINNVECLGLNPDDCTLAAFLHDFAKLESYKELPDGTFDKLENRWKLMDPETWTVVKCAEKGVVLPENQVNALLMAEGGWSAFARTTNRYCQPASGSLATVLHCADMISSQILSNLGHAKAA